jgi:hypothetical protein
MSRPPWAQQQQRLSQHQGAPHLGVAHIGRGHKRLVPPSHAQPQALAGLQQQRVVDSRVEMAMGRAQAGILHQLMAPVV